MFLLQATASESNERYPSGTKRTLLVFVKQDEKDPNFTLCGSIVKNCGWSSPDYKGAALATPEAVQGMQKTPEPAIGRTYQEAFQKGFGVLVFNDA